MTQDLISIDILQEKIFIIRNKRVMLDRDLAQLYGVETKRLNEAVKRNIKRFPDDFMFQLIDEEWNILRSQFATTNAGVSKIRSLPYAFTEHGVTMLSSVLNSEKAIEVNVQVVRAFIKLRQYAIESKELAERLTELERYFINHCNENTEDMQKIYSALALLMDRTKPSEIGFKTT